MIITIIVTAAVVIGADFALAKYGPDISDRFRASHAVDDITAGLHKLHLKLEAAITHHSDQADAHRQDAADSEAAAQAAQAEAVRAAQAADKLGALIA